MAKQSARDQARTWDGADRKAGAGVTTSSAPATFADALRVREFRWLWLAGMQSQIGDQLARVALAVLTFESTGSEILTTGVYALTMLPAIIGGIVLGPLADRVPRRSVLIACDVVRAVLIGAMALPGTSLALITTLLVVAVVIGAPYQAAEASLIKDMLPEGEVYGVGIGLRGATIQGSQLIGFGVGGLVVGLLGSRGSLGIDAGTFAISSLIVTATIHRRPAPNASRVRKERFADIWLIGLRAIFRDRQLSTLLGFAWLVGLYVVPEGLAAPLAGEIGEKTWTVGLLLAAMPTGSLIGSLLFSRLVVSARRSRFVSLMALLATAPMIACFTRPGLAVLLALWFAIGVFSAYQLQIQFEFMHAVPDAVRGQAVGVISSGLVAVQGLGLIFGGVVARFWNDEAAVGVAGAVALAISALLAGARRRVPAMPRSSE